MLETARLDAPKTAGVDAALERAWQGRGIGRDDALCRRYEPTAPTYWKRRDPPGPAEDSFRDQF